MPTTRAIRLVLLTAAAALVLYALIADPTGVGRGRETYFRATIRNLTDRNDALASNLAYVVNQYTLAAAGLALASLAFRPQRRS